MTTGPEGRIVRKILDYLNALPECRARKVHQDGYQRGEPDIDAVYRGRALKLEVKVPGGKPTPLQAKRLDDWSRAGAITGVVTSVDDVRALVDQGEAP